MVMPIVGMKMIGSVAPALTAGAAGVVVEILLLGGTSRFRLTGMANCNTTGAGYYKKH